MFCKEQIQICNKETHLLKSDLSKCDSTLYFKDAKIKVLDAKIAILAEQASADSAIIQEQSKRLKASGNRIKYGGVGAVILMILIGLL